MDDTDDSRESSLEKGSVDRRFSIESKINLAERRILCSPLISKHILSNDKFMQIRRKMEEDLTEKYKSDIEKISFQTDCWLIKGKDSISLEDHIDLFDIIIWRVPIIPACSHFDDEQEFYEKLNKHKEISDIDEITYSIYVFICIYILYAMCLYVVYCMLYAMRFCDYSTK